MAIQQVLALIALMAVTLGAFYLIDAKEFAEEKAKGGAA